MEQIDSLDYRQAEQLRLSLLKMQEERINNNILTGAKSAAKVIEFFTASRKADDLHFVDYDIHFEEDDIQRKVSQTDLKTYRWQFNELKAQGLDPVKWIKDKIEQED